MNSVVLKVILIEPVIAHYRKDVFQTFLGNKDFEFEIVAGSEYQGIESLENIGTVFNYTIFRFLKHNLYYLKGSLRYILSKHPDIIICTGVDFHLIHTVYLFFLWRILQNRRFYWWSHATTGNQGKFGFLIRRLFYKSSSGIFAYSMAGRDNLLSMKVSDQRIVVVNNSLNREDYGFMNHNLKRRSNSGIFRILYSGRITSEKKIDVLIHALGILKKKNIIDFRCYIIGDGEIEKLKETGMAEEINDKISFTGALYGKEVHQYFLNSDIFVYPGGIGLSVLHALSFGLPVLTTDNLSAHFPEFELIVPGFNGDLFSDDSPESLMLKLIEWKEKININRDVYLNNCTGRIDELGYLPDIMTNRVLNHLKSH